MDIDKNKSPAELVLDQTFVAQKQRVLRNLKWRMTLLCVVLVVGIVLYVASFLRGQAKAPFVIPIVLSFIFVPALMTLRRRHDQVAAELEMALRHGVSAA